MMGGLLLVAMVAVALSDVMLTLMHMLDLSFLRDVGGNVDGTAGVGAAGAGAAQALHDLEQRQAEYREQHPQAPPTDTPQSEWEKAQDKFWKSFWTGKDGQPR
jgi:hypothetical protein